MTVLVTGAGGFLGRPLVERLASYGYDVIAVDRSPLPATLIHLPNLKWIQRDILRDGLELLDINSVEIVFHLAGLKELPPQADETAFIKINEELTVQLMRSIKNKPRKIIFASTQMVYGDPGNLSVTEDFPLLGMSSSAYACSKLNTENWLRCLQRNNGGSMIALRLCGFIEGGGNIDYMIEQALLNRPIELYSNGIVSRDYLTIPKAIDAFVKASEYASNVEFEAFNIGFGQAVTTHELATLICKELKSESKIVRLERKAPRLDFVYNIDKAVKAIGFIPGDLRSSVQKYAAQKKALHERENNHETN